MKLSLVPLASLLVAIAACSTEPTQPAPPAAPAAETPAETPAVACEEGTYRLSSGACETFPSLAVTRSPTTIAPPRDHHTTMVIETTSGAWLYAVGGTDAWETLHDDILRAPIKEDGSVGPFEPAGKLPVARGAHCMVRDKERLLVFGGVVGGVRSGPSKTSLVIQLDAEGKVTGTTDGPELPIAVMHQSCDLVGDSVYVIGGRGKSSASTTLSARTRIGPDGVLSAFETMTALSPDRSHHAAFIKDKRLYVIGGLTGDPTTSYTDRKDVVYATIGDDGKLGEWTAAGNLPKALSVSSAQLYKDAVYIFGGPEPNGVFTNKIRRATFDETGMIGPFTTITTALPEARGHVHQTPIWKSFIYSVGGKDITDKSLDKIDIGRFVDGPPAR